MELIITAKVKLLTTDKQRNELLDTPGEAARRSSRRFYASRVALRTNLLSKFRSLQQLVYSDLRSTYGMKSQMACNICSVVAGTYASMKSNHENTIAEYKHPKLQYSYGRDYTFVKGKTEISLLTLNKRQKIVFETKAMERYFDGSWKFGTATLVNKKNNLFLHISVKKEIAESEIGDVNNIVGRRPWHELPVRSRGFQRQSQILFKERSARAHQKQTCRVCPGKEISPTAWHQESQAPAEKALAGRENRFMTDVNHCVSKALVKFAGQNSLLAIEDLTGINLSTRVRKRNRYVRFSWAFAQLELLLGV